jgi:hypothetical protein
MTQTASVSGWRHDDSAPVMRVRICMSDNPDQ